MAGQDIQRREILRVLGVAAVAAHFPGFVRWAYAAEHPSAEPAPVRPAAYTPQFFASQEYAVIEQLAQLIIPSDETPGAREAGAAEFVDFMVAHDEEQQQAMRTGLAWFKAHVERAFGQPFLALTESRQESLLEPLAYRAKYREGEEVGREFFRRIRELTVMGFYSSKIGYQELDNPALRYYAESPACPHTNDPAHRHLPAAKW
ncbi:MAG TPA: gluconate 2-dehydrogenase subunit 3 family protein [Steroidobacteraceae bacterium]